MGNKPHSPPLHRKFRLQQRSKKIKPSNTIAKLKREINIMKITKLVSIAATAVLMAVPVVQAQEEVHVIHIWEEPSTWWGNHFAYNTHDRYYANEVNFDMFGAYGASERGLSHLFDTNIRQSRNPGASAGGGIGINYFFDKYLGLGVDGVVLNNGGSFVDSVNASLIARLPIEPTGLAPYIFGGGGRNTEVWQWTAHAGVGLEFRFNPGTGIFADARYVWGEHVSADSLLLRGGLRFTF
jgi:hypothetical protein